MQQWEYLFVECASHGYAWHPRYANRQELPGWQRLNLDEYANQRGQEGWELVSVAVTDVTHRLVFKRPR